MSKYVPDIISHRWVIIASSRLSRPEETHSSSKQKRAKKKPCVFCENNENLSATEVFRIGKGKPNEPGWKVRVISNKYPITDYHEIVIHSPDHGKNIEDLSRQQVGNILLAYRERFRFYRKIGQVLIFCNNGEQAGASIEHSHSQIVVIPSQINLDTLAKEPTSNVVSDTPNFTSYCPDFSQWPYEVWIAPKDGTGKFADLTDIQVEEMADTLQKLIKQLRKIYADHRISHIPFAYNYYIYPGHNWYLRIIPRFVYRAGFELGTGLDVNIVDPSEAALELRGVESKIIGVLSKLKKKI